MYLLNETNVEVRMHDNQNFACKHHKKYTSQCIDFLVLWKILSPSRQGIPVWAKRVYHQWIFLRYWKMLLTEQSSWTRQIVSPNRLATESTVNWGKWFFSATGIVFVMITSWNRPLDNLSIAGGLSRKRVKMSTQIWMRWSV